MLQEYLKAHGKTAPIVYGGAAAVQKSGLLLMLETLGIELIHLTESALPDTPDLLITVDCQPGESNVQWLDCRHLAILDHHEEGGAGLRGIPVVYKEIRTDYAACSTLLWSRLRTLGFRDISTNAATALYYGLYSDSNKFQAPLYSEDEAMRLELNYDRRIFRRLQGSNISQADLEIVLRALGGYRRHASWYFAVAQAQPCDPNLLGLTSDILIEVNVVDVCVVFCLREDHIKLSIRSCIDEVKADELADYITSQIPDSDGGGAASKAGGKLDLAAFLRETAGDGGADGGDRLESRAADFLYDCVETYFRLMMGQSK